MAQAVAKVIERGGTVIIPSFAFYALQKIEAENLTFYGSIETDEKGLTIRFDEALLNSAHR